MKTIFASATVLATALALALAVRRSQRKLADQTGTHRGASAGRVVARYRGAPVLATSSGQMGATGHR